MRWYLWIPFISTVAAIPVALITFIVMSDGYSDLFFYFLPVFFCCFYLAPCITATNFVVGIRMRAMASDILLFVLNLIGLGLGPMVTGFVSDWLTPTFGTDALRYAMSLTVLVNIWCALHYYWAIKTIRDDIALAAE